MQLSRLEQLFARFPEQKILVLGDFFLDKYLLVNPALREVSLETGLEAHQVTGLRCSPGAAGTVTNNLRAMEVQVLALGVVGDDGEGYELKRALVKTGVDVSNLITRGDCLTPTYCKPIYTDEQKQVREMCRFDNKNRTPLPAQVEDELIDRLRQLLPRVRGVIALDQVQEADCGVLSGRVREELAKLARANPDKIVAADSRERIGLFREVFIKPNAREATRVLHPERETELDRAGLEKCGVELFQRNRRPVFVTMGPEGILVCSEKGPERVPAIPVQGPIDIVGAGDSTMAGITSALCAGADFREAARVGTLAANVTIRQIGTTGTASRKQMSEAFAKFLAS